MNGYFEEINENKHLMLVPTNENKEEKKNTRNWELKSNICLGQYLTTHIIIMKNI